MKRVLVAFLLVTAGCAGGSGEKKEARTADDEKAPPPPSDEKIQEAKAKQEEKKPANQPTADAQLKAKKAAVVDRAEFDATVKKWEDAKKDKDGLTKAEAKSLGSKFASLASSHPDLAAQAHFNAGTLYDQAGDAKEAESEYNAALGANPAYGPALNNLGEIYYRTGSPQRAREWFEKAIKADPSGTSSAYTNLALLIFQEAKDSGNTAGYKDAVSKLRRALAIDNYSMPAYALLALIYYTTAENDRSKLQLAELVCKQAKEADDKYAPVYNTLGLIQLKKRNVTGALKEFEKAVELDPRYVEAHLNIGAIALSSRQYEKAEKAFNQVLALKPDSVDATIGLAVALRGEKKIEEAEKTYKKAKELDPKNCAVAYNLGVLYQDYKNDPNNQNLKDAQKYYNDYVSCGGKTTQAKIADAQRRIKDIDDTFAALEQQKKLEAELKVQQEEMEKQQKAMEEQQKAQEAAQKNAPPEKKEEAPAPKDKK
jgi:tetratricopeptide (TPR) repeat protein